MSFCAVLAPICAVSFLIFSPSAENGKSVRRQFFPPFDFKTMFFSKTAEQMQQDDDTGIYAKFACGFLVSLDVYKVRMHVKYSSIEGT